MNFNRLLVTAGLVGTLALSACSSSGSTSSNSTSNASTSSTPVSIALSWTPNTDYTGIYVAEQRGYYKEAGIDLTVQPYASTAPETLVSNGTVDFGFSYQAGATYARAAGQDVISVFAPDQKGTYAIGVSEKRTDITSPRDLDGKTYAGFGTPDEVPLLQTVIRNDGGKGEFTNATLNTSAYEAVSNGSADFTIPTATWDAVQAKAAGKPMKLFALTDYGFPDQYSVLIASSQKYLTANPDVAKRFLAATQKGYQFAAEHPAEAAADVVAANPGTFPNPALVTESQQALVDGHYLTDSNGAVGRQSLDRWKAYAGFLFTNKLLTDGQGKPVTVEPDWSTYFTNDYLN